MVFRVADFEGGATPPTPTPVILKTPLPQKINKRQGEKGKRKPDNQTCKKFFNNLQVHFTSIGVCCIYVHLLVVMSIFMEYGNTNADANSTVSFILIQI